jgi:hypothetical protein
MRDLFYLLNRSGITVDISTFSKACKQRCDQYFRRIYTQLRQQLMRNNPTAAKMLFPIDSTVVSLTSKLFWVQGQHQVKLLNGVNLSQDMSVNVSYTLDKGMKLNLLTTLLV